MNRIFSPILFTFVPIGLYSDFVQDIKQYGKLSAKPI